MINYNLGDIERKFADLIWDHEPVASRELVRLAAEALGWKKSTTYTVLRRLADRGIFENNNGTVTSRISRGKFASRQSRQFVAHNFGDSLPDFIAAFTDGRPLEPAEIEALRRLIHEDET